MNIENLDIEKLVISYVKEKVDECDIENIIQHEGKSVANDLFAEKSRSIVGELVSEIIKIEVLKVLDAAIVINDGYRVEKYDSFEQFIKTEFKKRLTDDYKIKAVIENLAKQRVDSLIKQEYAKVTEKIVDVLTQSTLVKK